MTPKRSMPLWLAIFRRNEIDWRGNEDRLIDETLLDKQIYAKTKRLRNPRTARRKFKGRYLLDLAVGKMRIKWRKERAC